MMVGSPLIILLLVLLMVEIHSSMSDTHARGDTNCKTKEQDSRTRVAVVGLVVWCLALVSMLIRP